MTFGLSFVEQNKLKLLSVISTLRVIMCVCSSQAQHRGCVWIYCTFTSSYNSYYALMHYYDVP